MKGRRMAEAYRRALTEFAPAAFANSFVVATGAVLGVRETRRVTGDYVLTLEDYAERRSFPDEICRNSYFIDLHQTKEEHKAKMDESRRPPASSTTAKASRTAFPTAA